MTRRALRHLAAAALSRLEDVLSATSMRLTLWRQERSLFTEGEEQMRSGEERTAWRPPAMPREGLQREVAREVRWGQRGGEA